MGPFGQFRTIAYYSGIHRLLKRSHIEIVFISVIEIRKCKLVRTINLPVSIKLFIIQFQTFMLFTATSCNIVTTLLQILKASCHKPTERQYGLLEYIILNTTSGVVSLHFTITHSFLYILDLDILTADSFGISCNLCSCSAHIKIQSLDSHRIPGVFKATVLYWTPGL